MSAGTLVGLGFLALGALLAAFTLRGMQRASEDAERFDCTACLDGEVVTDTCDGCGDRHCIACDPCEGEDDAA